MSPLQITPTWWVIKLPGLRFYGTSERAAWDNYLAWRNKHTH